MNRRELLGIIGLVMADKASAALGLMPGSAAETPAPPAPPIWGEVKTEKGRPALFINGRIENPMFYALTDCPGGRWTWEELPAESIANFAKLGFRLIQVDVFLSQMWGEDGTLDINLARQQMRGILRLRADAAVFLRVHLNAPEWWKLRWPEELTKFSDTAIQSPKPFGLRRLIDFDLEASPQASLASERWRSDAGAILQRFCHELSACPEGNSVAGMQVACGVFGEWHYWGFLAHDPDTGEAMTSHFREWLHVKYRTNDALRTAWGDRLVRIDNALVPSTAERKSSGDGMFRDPNAERNVIDYVTCQHETVATDIVHFCRIVKENWPRPIVTGAFYGYFFSVFGREASGGHLASEIVLNSPHVDYLSAPQAYYSSDFREIGGTGQSRGLLESCRLHGKLWLDEMDQEPHLDPRKNMIPNNHIDMHAKPDDIAILRRDVAQVRVHGMGLWFYDFGYSNQSGWWNDPDLLREIGAIKAIFDGYVQRPYRPASDVLVVYDTTVFRYLSQSEATSDTVSWTMVNRLSAELYHSGVAFDQIYLSDLPLVDLNRYKAIIFANTFVLSLEQKKWVLEQAAKNGRHLIWIGAPGYCDGSKLSEDFVTEVTGMAIQRLRATKPPVVTATAKPLPNEGLHSEAFFVPSRATAFGPVFAVSDARAEVFGTIDGEGLPGLARLTSASHTSWFSAVPIDRADVLRSILTMAGAHVYCDAGDALHVSGDFILIHSKSGGDRIFSLLNGKAIHIRLAPHSTIMMDAESGQILL